MLQKLFKQLQKRKWVALLLALLYATAIILLHDSFVQLSIVLMNKFSLPRYNELVRNTFVVLGGSFFLFLIVMAFKHPERTRVLFYLFSTMFLLIVHSLFLLEMNIEIIHAVEYAVLAVLFFTATGKFGLSIVLCIPVMLIDEYLQYEIFYPSYSLYFEFNDIVLDVLGCAFALIALKVFLPNWNSERVVFYRRKEFIMISSTCVLFFLLYALCVFSQHTSTMCSNTIFNMSRLENFESFWHIHHFTKAKYHVLSPTAGVLLIYFLSLFVMGLDGYSSTAKTSPSKMV